MALVRPLQILATSEVSVNVTLSDKNTSFITSFFFLSYVNINMRRWKHGQTRDTTSPLSSLCTCLLLKGWISRIFITHSRKAFPINTHVDGHSQAHSDNGLRVWLCVWKREGFGVTLAHSASGRFPLLSSPVSGSGLSALVLFTFLFLGREAQVVRIKVSLCQH